VGKENKVIGRIPISKVWPEVDGGDFPAKAFDGEVIAFGATAFREGHDLIAVELLLTSPKGESQRIRLQEGRLGLDEWTTQIRLDQLGTWNFQISAWDDEYHTWLHNAEVKLAASIDEELMMLEGEKLLNRLAEGAKGKDKKALTEIATKLVASG